MALSLHVCQEAEAGRSWTCCFDEYVIALEVHSQTQFDLWGLPWVQNTNYPLLKMNVSCMLERDTGDSGDSTMTVPSEAHLIA